MNYLLAFGCTMASVFLKGIQHKNIQRDMFKATFVVSYFMAFMDMFLIGLIVRSDWTIAFASGAGAAIGMVTAMRAHNHISTLMGFNVGNVEPDQPKGPTPMREKSGAING
jgi:hypothetical protein